MNNLVTDNVSNGDSIRVAIIDTGIDVDHPDLVDNIKGGYNATSKKKSYDDDNGHGTHVAGIIGAVDNEIGVIGVLPDVDLYAVKALNSEGNGFVTDLVEGINWCIDNDVDIINMSLSLESESVVLHESIQRACGEDILMVAAAGNNYGGDCLYPGQFDEVVGVGALNEDGDIASFSACTDIDAWAPGVDIYSTYVDDTYKTNDGTSMAAPHFIVELLMKE